MDNKSVRRSGQTALAVRPFVAIAVTLITSTNLSAFVPILAGPMSDASVTNQAGAVDFYSRLVGDGVAIQTTFRYAGGGGTFTGNHAFRWDASGLPAVDLGGLTAGPTGNTSSAVNVVLPDGTAFGASAKYAGSMFIGFRPVRWSASSGTVFELPILGTDATGYAGSVGVYAASVSGMSVGSAYKYVGGISTGPRAVRWNPAGTTITELDPLSFIGNGTSNYAFGVNASGTTVGSAEKWNSNADVGSRAVRWVGGGTTIEELGNLGTMANGATNSRAVAVNASGLVIGSAQKYTSTQDLGARAVMWGAAGPGVTELSNLGTDASGTTTSTVYVINDQGTAVGSATKYVGGVSWGKRAVRWSLPSNTVVELATLGASPLGVTTSEAFCVNADGVIVGSALRYSNGASTGERAVCWDPNGAITDLNSLVNPASGWTLVRALGISDSGWVTGVGKLDPDLNGPLPSYATNFLIHLPEPASMSAFAVFVATLFRRDRRAAR